MNELNKKIDRFNKLYGGDIAYQDLSITVNYDDEVDKIRFIVSHSLKNFRCETVYSGFYEFAAFYHETIHTIANTILSNALLHVLEKGRI